MNMFRHHHIADDHEAVPLADLFQNPQERIPPPRAAQQGSATETGTRDKVQGMSPVEALKARRHNYPIISAASLPPLQKTQGRGTQQLNYAMNRFDSGRYGRFMSMDRLAGSVASPQSLNQYAYAGNDPINRADPTGLDYCLENNCPGGAGGPGPSWEFGSWDHGGIHGGAGVEACGVDTFCIQRGGIGPFGSPVADPNNAGMQPCELWGWGCSSTGADRVITVNCSDSFDVWECQPPSQAVDGSQPYCSGYSLGCGVFRTNGAIFQHANGGVETITKAYLAIYGTVLGLGTSDAAADTLFGETTFNAATNSTETGLLNQWVYLRYGWGYLQYGVVPTVTGYPAGMLVLRIASGGSNMDWWWHNVPF